MDHRIKVHVRKYSDRPNFLLQWNDPVTGRLRTLTTNIPQSGGRKARDEAAGLAREYERKLGLQQNLWVESLGFCAGLCPGPRGL